MVSSVEAIVAACAAAAAAAAASDSNWLDAPVSTLVTTPRRRSSIPMACALEAPISSSWREMPIETEAGSGTPTYPSAGSTRRTARWVIVSGSALGGYDDGPNEWKLPSVLLCMRLPDGAAAAVDDGSVARRSTRRRPPAAEARVTLHSDASSAAAAQSTEAAASATLRSGRAWWEV